MKVRITISSCLAGEYVCMCIKLKLNLWLTGPKGATPVN